MGTSTSTSSTPNISDDDSSQDEDSDANQDEDGDANQDEADENGDRATAKGAGASDCDTQGDGAIYAGNATANVPATTYVSDSVAVAVPATTMGTTATTVTLPTVNEGNSGADSNGPGLGDDDISTNMPDATAAVTATLAVPAAAEAATTMVTATTPAPSDAATAVDDVETIFSRHDLQGASSVTGGVLQGRAQGNVYNMADDMEVESPFIKPAFGKFMFSNLRTILT